MKQNNNKESSVEWLQWALEHTILTHEQTIQTIGLFEQAKEMHKEEIEDAYDKGCYDEYEYHINNEPRKNSEIYYNETFEK